MVFGQSIEIIAGLLLTKEPAGAIIKYIVMIFCTDCPIKKSAFGRSDNSGLLMGF